MGMEDFFASLPRGKEDKPLLFGMGPLTYDIHDVDGLYFMLDEKLSGCLIMMWAKPMNPDVKGRITLDGKAIDKYVLQPMAVMGGMWILAIPLRGHINETGKKYNLHVEEFVDTDGNEMNPQDFEVESPERVLPQKEYSSNEDIALEAAREGIVLLENRNNTLPLKENTTLNLFGRGVHEFRNGAVGAGKITPRYSVNFVEAIRDRKNITLNEDLVRFYSCDEDRIPDDELIKAAKEKSDIAVMMISRAAGENMDLSTKKGEYYLTDDEEALLSALRENFSRLIVVLNVGYPISMNFVSKYRVDALIYSGFGGMLGGEALLDVMLGKVNPSGKLTDTWALDYKDIPASVNFYDCNGKKRLNAECSEYVDTVYEEGIYVGYRYFETFGKEVAYPFGYGLSYTDFVIEAEEPVIGSSKICISAHVKNVGKLSGKEVVQIYVKKPDVTLEKPSRELVFFDKTDLLEPLEMHEFDIEVPLDMLASYSEAEKAYIVEAGRYEFFAGNSVKASGCGFVDIKEKTVIRKTEDILNTPVAFTQLSKKDPKGTYPKGKLSGIVKDKVSFAPYAPRKKYEASKEYQADEKSVSITFEDVKKDAALAKKFVGAMTPLELSRLSVCASSGWGMEGVGEAGRIFKVEGKNLPDFPVSDGNSGVNLKIPNIGMPSGVTLCSSFNKRLIEQVGKAIGNEAKKLGMPMILAPGFNIHRNPLNGRNPEYFSEDPFLSGTMAGCYTRGLESTGTAACMKHFALNNCESSRKRNTSYVSVRALREIYLKNFEIAMKEHMPASVMTAYNALNGVPTAADPELLIGFLRKELGFDGFIMTDWTSYDTVDIPAMVDAGNCWITPGSTDDTYTAQILKGLDEGKTDLERLKDNVYHIVKTLARFS